MSTPIHLLAVLRGTIRMMGIRGYDVNRYEFLERINPRDLESTYGQNYQVYMNDPLLRMIIIEENFSMRTMMSTILYKEDGTSCLIFFSPVEGKDGKKSSIENPRFFLTLMNTPFVNQDPNNPRKPSTGILVTYTPLTPKGTATINEFHESKKIQHYTDEDIQLNPSIHIYNPYARVLSQIESDNFFKTNPIEQSKMPRNISDEAYTKYLGAFPKSLIEYERFSLLPGMLTDEEIFHRGIRRPITGMKKTEKKRPA